MEPEQHFGDDRYALRLGDFLKFEIKSLVGRWRSPARRKPAAPLLQIGSGSNLIDGFDNLDFYSVRGRGAKIATDLRFPLPYDDRAYDGAFSEHTLEHLRSADALQLLREVRRVLKPGSVFRVVVPDLAQYIAFYNGAATSPEFGRFASGCEAIWSLTQNYGHLSCWDEGMLTRQLVAAGFTSASRASFGRGCDPRLVQDQPSRRWESLYVDAVA